MLEDIENNEENDNEASVIEENFIKTKGKCKSYLRPNDIYLELKSRKRVGKCRGAGHFDILDVRILMEPNNNNISSVVYNTIPNEIWYNVADHIPPEYVQTFALICRQTADLVNTRRFWKQLYKNYCLRSNGVGWILTLPEHLQVHSLRSCDKVTMRARVIESLFLIYAPLSQRTAQAYSLDKLHGYSYEASWHEQENCAWIMCYKFRQKNIPGSKQDIDLTDLVTDDWETLAENKYRFKTRYTAPQNHLNEGVVLLVIRCERYIPFPNQLLYENGGSRVLLLGMRQMLAKDMRGTNLELDFGDTSRKVINTVKYPKVMSVKAYPWWYPEFRKYMK